MTVNKWHEQFGFRVCTSWLTYRKQVSLTTHLLTDQQDRAWLCWHIILLQLQKCCKNLPRLYDPLGFLAPVTVQAKILLQEIWQLKIKWDDSLNDSHSVRWQELSYNIKESIKMELPWHFFTTTVNEPVLHVFADASIKAYGTVAYLCADSP